MPTVSGRTAGGRSSDQEITVGNAEELSLRRGMLEDAMDGLNEREQHILRERRLQDEPTTLEDLSKSMESAANEFARSKFGRSKSCKFP